MKQLIDEMIIKYKEKTEKYKGDNWYIEYLKNKYPQCNQICIYPMYNGLII